MSCRFAAVLVLAALLAACSEPPIKERQQAEGAIEAARAAGAETYASAEFSDAQASLKRYDDAVAQRDYRQALSAALDARDRAYDAAKQASNKKSELRSQADRLAAELTNLIAATNSKLGAPAPRPVTERLKSARDAADQALQEARALDGRQDYPAAVARLTPAIETLRRELNVQQAPAPPKRKK
jgi:predicted S18 family serine protease